MAAGIFQLTGWLQTIEALPISDRNRYTRLELYSKCLDWYNTLLAIQPDPYAGTDNSAPCPVGRGVEECTGVEQFKVFTQ